MARAIRKEDLEPTFTPPGVDRERQRETLQQLYDLEMASRSARDERDELILANALSHSLSRGDMGRAVGLSRSRIDQLIAQRSAALGEARTRALRERARRHLP